MLSGRSALLIAELSQDGTRLVYDLSARDPKTMMQCLGKTVYMVYRELGCTDLPQFLATVVDIACDEEEHCSWPREYIYDGEVQNGPQP